jgi:hypothetical protein
VKRTATALLALAVLAAPTQARAGDRAPALPNAKAAIVIDGRNGEVMFAKRPQARREIGRSSAPPTTTRPRWSRRSGCGPASACAWLTCSRR